MKVVVNTSGLEKVLLDPELKRKAAELGSFSIVPIIDRVPAMYIIAPQLLLQYVDSKEKTRWGIKDYANEVDGTVIILAESYLIEHGCIRLIRSKSELRPRKEAIEFVNAHRKEIEAAVKQVLDHRNLKISATP